jgi:hypothetical protein
MTRLITLLSIAVSLAFGCDPDEPGPDPSRSWDAASVQHIAVDVPHPCPPGTDDWGCPGMPCAHGHCFVGECVGVGGGEDGQTEDPGVCCATSECDAD